MFLYVDISAMYKNKLLISMDYFIPQKSFQTFPLFLSLGNLSQLSALPLTKIAMVYTILDNRNHFKCNWSKLVSLSTLHITYTLCKITIEVLTVEDLRRNVLSKNIFSLS